jgi:hypothetical protein
LESRGRHPRLAEPRLDFGVEEGLNINSFVRQGSVAAHLLLRSGTDPRILAAFPAGDSGAGLWFAHRATVAAPELVIRKVVLSSVRVLRDHQSLGRVPTELGTAPSVHGRTISWSPDRLDGAAGYRLALEVTDGALDGERLRAGADG